MTLFDAIERYRAISRKPGVERLTHQDEHRAIADAGEAIRFDPGIAIVYANRAGLFARKGDYDKAIADASEITGLPRDMFEVYEISKAEFEASSSQ